MNDRYGNVQCPPSGGSCIKDRVGDIQCSPADGGVLLDRYQVPVCGPGQCVTDIKAAAQACPTPSR